MFRIEYVSELYASDYFFGIVSILLVLEACRRVIGWSLVIVTASFILYAFIGPWLPGDIGHRGIQFKNFIDMNLLASDGLFGIPIAVMVIYVFYFLRLRGFFYIFSFWYHRQSGRKILPRGFLFFLKKEKHEGMKQAALK